MKSHNTISRLSIRFLAFYLLPLLMLQACSGGAILVESERKFSDTHQPIKKIVCIEPDFLSIDQRKKVEDVVLSSEDLEGSYQKYLVQTAKKNGIELEILSPNTLKANQIDYFNTLLPLKQKILFANSTQDISINSYKGRRVKYKTKAGRGIYDYGLEFDIDYASLAQKYGTPYFSINGLLNLKKRRKVGKWVWLFLFPPSGIHSFMRGNSETLYYHILVDVSRSEVVYREIRSFNDPLDKSNLKSMLYDSFNILND
ncbi:MAG: hypothetical protein AAF696_30425 [Bacteroidota bacterium]